MPEIFKTNVSKRFLSTKSPFEFVFSCCEFTTYFVVKNLYAIQKLLKYIIWMFVGYLVFGFISLEDDPTSNLRLTDQVYPTR